MAWDRELQSIMADLEGLIADIEAELKTAEDDGYNKGYEAGYKDAKKEKE